MFPAPRPEADAAAAAAPVSEQESLYRQFRARSDRALRIAERFCTFRSRCKPKDMVDMFTDQGAMVTINNVVCGKPSIFAASEDGQRFTHLAKWFKPWVVCQNSLDNPQAASTITVEREGRIFTGVWFFDPSYINIRETCVVEDDQIVLFSTQRKF